MKVALCYDRINKFGGAERVLQVLHEMWPDAPVYTLTHSEKTALWSRGWKIRTSFLQKIPILGNKHELFPPFASLAWENFQFDSFDVVISVTSSEAKSILIPPHTVHLCYCLTPTRYYWSGYYDYRSKPGLGKWNIITGLIFGILAFRLRVVDFFHAQRPRVLIGISDQVCQRIKKYYRRSSVKIYPPVSIPPFMLQDKTKNYFLVVSRLVPYKRIDIVIDAFTSLGWPLVVVGEGSELYNLQRHAGSSIKFKGFVENSELADLYSNSVALIFPTLEDFGIVPVEAQSYGIPVVAYRGGGALETVTEGHSGIFFDEQSAQSLKKLLLSISPGGDFDGARRYFSSFSEEDLRANALKFSSEIFKSQLKAVVHQAWEENLKTRPNRHII